MATDDEVPEGESDAGSGQESDDTPYVDEAADEQSEDSDDRGSNS